VLIVMPIDEPGLPGTPQQKAKKKTAACAGEYIKPRPTRKFHVSFLVPTMRDRRHTEISVVVPGAPQQKAKVKKPRLMLNKKQ